MNALYPPDAPRLSRRPTHRKNGRRGALGSNFEIPAALNATVFPVKRTLRSALKYRQ
jgi:hypothetical protein